jgi:hypothetical protein
MEDVLEVIKDKPKADESLDERSLQQVDAVIQLVEVVFGNFIMDIGFFNRRMGNRGKFNIGTHQHFVKKFEHRALARSERLRYTDDECIIWKRHG